MTAWAVNADDASDTLHALTRVAGLSEWVGRSFAGVQPIQLRPREWRLEQKRRLLEAPEHLGDEVHAIPEIGPVHGAGLMRAVTRRIDPIEQITELGQDDFPK